MADPLSSKYPIDFDEYEIGDMIAADVIEDAYGCSRSDDNYWAKMLAMREACMQSFRQRGLVVTVVSKGDDLLILTDAEASKYNSKNFYEHVRGAARAHARMAGVDVTKLSDPQRTEHTFQHARMGRMLHAALDARREVAASSTDPTVNTKRITPGRDKENKQRANPRRHDQRTLAPSDAQQPTGEPAGPAGEADEADHLEEKEDGGGPR